MEGYLQPVVLFSFFKKKPQQPEATFKRRVERFWNWYAEVAPRFFKTIEAGKCSDLAAEVGRQVEELWPGFAWVFGPVAEGAGHSFTLSGEGVLHGQLLAIYCVSRAPVLGGWTFHASRQPGSLEQIRMEIGGREFNPMEFWITPMVDDAKEKVDITAWHPLFKHLNEKERYQPLFLFLDEALGEYATEAWLGEIKVNDQRLSDSIPLNELLQFITELERKTGWKKLAPGDVATMYEPKQRHEHFLRGDVIVGTTMHPRLISDYLGSEGELADPLAGSGADYAFVSFDMKILPPGKQTAGRAAIEDALDRALRTARSGRLLGGALGGKYAYIDLLLFDGPDSLKIVQDILHEQHLPAGTAINFFAREKRDQRLVL